MKEYTNNYSGIKINNSEQGWTVNLYNGDDIENTITGLDREEDANAMITTWVVQEGWTNMDKTEDTDPVDWENPLFQRDFIKQDINSNMAKPNSRQTFIDYCLRSLDASS